MSGCKSISLSLSLAPTPSFYCACLGGYVQFEPVNIGNMLYEDYDTKLFAR